MLALPMLLSVALAPALTELPPAYLPDSLIDTSAIPAGPGLAVHAPEFMVSSAHRLASEAGAAALRAGGSAADAAVAVQAALAVVEPESSGPGGGCLILYYNADSGLVTAIDGREEAPASIRPDVFLDEEGLPLQEIYSGGIVVGVPGTIAALSELHRRHGLLPLAETLSGAIALAEDGFPVGRDLARASRTQRHRLLRFPAARDLYLRPDSSALAIGDTLRNPNLADLLRLWGDNPDGRFFYRGEIARSMVRTVREAPFRPGTLAESDLQNYRAVERRAIHGSYRGHKLAVFPPPTSGGITLLEILGILERAPGKESGQVARLDQLARASAVAFADRGAWLGDQDWSPSLTMTDLLDEAFLSLRARRAFTPDTLWLPTEAEDPREKSHTTHFSIVDAAGNMLACTSTIETVFGSAMVVPDWGFVLNNELTDFNWRPSVPAAANDVEAGKRLRRSSLDAGDSEGGKRPRSSMCPVLVLDDEGRAVMALGSPGGSRIIGTVATVLLGVLDEGLALQEAVNKPRLHCRNRPLEIETWGWNRPALADTLAARGWPIAALWRWPHLQGDVNAVGVLPDGTREGAADPRHDGAAVGG